jgi:hypothetical protein
MDGEVENNLHTILNVVDNGKKNLDRAVSLAVL